MSKSLYTTIIEATAPLSTTIGVVGQLYLDSSTKILYQCVAINIDNLTYEWKPIGGGPTQEDFDKLVNNEIQIKSNSYDNIVIGDAKAWENNGLVAIGKNALSKGNRCIAIGKDTIAGGTFSISIGGSSQTEKSYGISIGYQAISSNNSAIQLGTGTNSKTKSLQVFDDNIYDANTHTLTVQNIELNGTDLNDTLNEVTSKAMRALLTPVSAPTTTELIAVDNSNAQTMIEIGDGLIVENGVLKSKKLLWSGELVGDVHTSNNNYLTKSQLDIKDGDTIEVEWDVALSSYGTIRIDRFKLAGHGWTYTNGDKLDFVYQTGKRYNIPLFIVSTNEEGYSVEGSSISLDLGDNGDLKFQLVSSKRSETKSSGTTVGTAYPATIYKIWKIV